MSRTNENKLKMKDIATICEYKATKNHSGKYVWETGNHFCNRCFER